MNASRWISLLIIVPYVISFVVSPIWDEPRDAFFVLRLRVTVVPGCTLVVLGLICLWWPEALVWIPFVNSERQLFSESMIQVLGWILLFLAIVMALRGY